MKLQNLKRFDPDVIASGHTGLVRGSKLEGLVWEQYGDNIDLLIQDSDLIRNSIHSNEIKLESLYEDLEVQEGALILKMHMKRERNRKIIKSKKHDAIQRLGKLDCEVCGFSFSQKYGQLGDDFIEVHHNIHVSQMKPGDATRLADLSIVCANCHRMLHRRVPFISVSELRGLILSLAQAEGAP